jgi:hypothetical protein
MRFVGPRRRNASISNNTFGCTVAGSFAILEGVAPGLGSTVYVFLGFAVPPCSVRLLPAAPAEGFGAPFPLFALGLFSRFAISFALIE